MTVSNSTFSGNNVTSWGGGIYNSSANTATPAVTNSTLYGNGAAVGGGIYITGTLTVANSTLSGNSATQGGGIYKDSVNGRLNLNNTIVGGNSASAVGPDLYGAVTTGDYNLVQNSSGATLSGSNNITGQAPRLSALADNGGPTQTMALQSGSPAINAGDPAVNGTGETDQRGTGYARVLDGRLDIGAFEYDPTNQAPVHRLDGTPLGATATVTTPENTTLVLNDANSNRLSITDVDAGTSPVRVTLTSVYGRITLPVTTGLTFTAGSNHSASMTFTGTLADINRDLNGLSFSPTPNYARNGAKLTLTTNDLGNTGTGGAQTTRTVFTVNITPVDAAPVAHNEGYSVAGNNVLHVDAAHGVLANDTDLDKDPLTVAAPGPVTAPSHGTLTLNPDGSFTYTPATGPDSISETGGTDSFTYQASDGTKSSNTATVTITVTAAPAGGSCGDIMTIGSPPLQITRYALHYNFTTRRYVQQILLLNTGHTAISGPVFIVLDHLAGATFFNKSGDISCFDNSGSPYLTLNSTLAPGGSEAINLEFSDKTGAITYSTRILAGHGTP